MGTAMGKVLTEWLVGTAMGKALTEYLVGRAMGKALTEWLVGTALSKALTVWSCLVHCYQCRWDIRRVFQKERTSSCALRDWRVKAALTAESWIAFRFFLPTFCETGSNFTGVRFRNGSKL